jgi:esterase
MKLFYRTYGSGPPLMILHGLFGQSDNWNTLSKQFAEAGHTVYAVDLRNHGLSPHSSEWSYPIMADDVAELVTDLGLTDLTLLGHSMGGMVSMQFAQQHPGMLDKLIVADMAPKAYPPHHSEVIRGLQAVDFQVIKTRKEAEQILSTYVGDAGTRQFLLKNLFWKDDTQLAWRFNLDVIAKNYGVLAEIGNAANPGCAVPSWFIRGERSDYVTDTDWTFIHQIFPDSTLITIPGAGHWLHAEQPRLFYEAVIGIVGQNSLSE